jgi:hypothetical protein
MYPKSNDLTSGNDLARETATTIPMRKKFFDVNVLVRSSKTSTDDDDVEDDGNSDGEDDEPPPLIEVADRGGRRRQPT